MNDEPEMKSRIGPLPPGIYVQGFMVSKIFSQFLTSFDAQEPGKYGGLTPTLQMKKLRLSEVE